MDSQIAEPDAAARIASIPIEEIDVARPSLFQNDTIGLFFDRLRAEEPVHYCRESYVGPYWSITKFDDIMAVDTNHKVFSSEAKLGGIAIQDMHSVEGALELEMFIAMDPPKHDQQRKAVTPAVAPSNLQLLEPIIRKRAGEILDELPIGEDFDWVDKVAIELTTMTLATLFDFPWEERRKLTRWSDVATAAPETGIVESYEARREDLIGCAMYFKTLWDERPHLEDGSFSRHARHAVPRVSLQSYAADRRWKRHNTQFHQRRRARLEPKPGRVRETRRGSFAH